MSDLGSAVRRCPLASTTVGGDCYSLGYSVARESVSRAVAYEVVLGLDLTRRFPARRASVTCPRLAAMPADLPCLPLGHVTGTATARAQALLPAELPWQPEANRQRISRMSHSHRVCDA
jgi:hypothetical protein